MNLRIVSETPTTITVEWTPPLGQQVVRTTRPDGTQSRFWDSNKRSHTFKKKQEGSYLVDALGLLDAGSVDYPIDTPPPATGQGAKLRAAFPPFPAPKTTVENRTFTTRQYKSGTDLLWRNVEVTGPESHAFEAAGGNDRVTYELCRVHDLLRDNPGQPDGDHNSCEGYSMHEGPGQVRILGGETWNVGTSRFSHAVYAGSVAKLLVAGHLAHDVGDYVYQLYPGEGKTCQATITNNTFGWPLSTSGVALVVWAESGSWTCDVYNSIIWGKVQTNGNATLRLHNCVVPPQFSIDSDVVLDNCLRIDPAFTGHYVPTDPRVLSGADPGWVPPFDHSGKPYARNTIGAVAA